MKNNTLLRNFVFTKNNYTQDDIDALLVFPCQYMIFAKEVAPTTGTPHLQGYCELKTAKRFSALTKLGFFGNIEPRQGTQQDAINYIEDPQKTESGRKKVKRLPTPRISIESESLKDKVKIQISIEIGLKH